jgi:hypothetical protein
MFYIDEDSWQAAVIDQYDGRQQLWRVSEAYGLQFPEVPEFWEAAETVYDLQNGRYLVLGLNNHEPQIQFDAKLPLDDFTPDALRRLGVR